MNKLFKILLFLLILWLISNAIATYGFNKETDVIGDKVALIPIKGMITLEGTSTLLQQTTSGNEIVEKLEDANQNNQVKAIVLEINSPGGTVIGSKVVADKIKEIEKPIIAVVTEYGTSGAYWIASQADYIIADELSFIGSISVVGSHLEFAGLLENYNITYRQLTTGDYKDLGTPYRTMTNQEQELLMQRLEGIHNYFVNEVAQGRNMTIEQVQQFDEGLFYLGYNAIDLGLIDEIGNKDKAIEKAKELSGISDGSVKEYKEKETFFDKIKKFTTQSSFSIGQGIGSVFISNDELIKVS